MDRPKSTSPITVVATVEVRTAVEAGEIQGKNAALELPGTEASAVYFTCSATTRSGAGETITCDFTVTHLGDFPQSWKDTVHVAATDEDGVGPVDEDGADSAIGPEPVDQAEAAKARFADVATTPEGDLRVERIAAVVAVVAVVGGWLVYRRLRQG